MDFSPKYPNLLLWIMCNPFTLGANTPTRTTSNVMDIITHTFEEENNMS
jgi:hypothetical protein